MIKAGLGVVLGLTVCAVIQLITSFEKHGRLSPRDTWPLCLIFLILLCVFSEYLDGGDPPWAD